MIIEMVLWILLGVRDAVVDRTLSHVGAVILLFVAIALLVFNIFVLAVGGFW